jgi:hypothetical protein
MALDPRWRRTPRTNHPGINARSVPAVMQWALGLAGLVGVLGFLYYLSVSAPLVNFFAQNPP